MKSQDDYPMATLAELATPAELRGLYLSISKRLHPDRPGGSTEAMQKLNATWDAIKSGDSDGQYVRGLAAKRRERAGRIMAEDREVFADIAERWNERLADLGIQATVTPASMGLFVLTLYDLREDEIGTALDAKLRESEPF